MANLMFLLPLIVVVGVIAFSIPLNQALIAWGEKEKGVRQQREQREPSGRPLSPQI